MQSMIEEFYDFESNFLDCLNRGDRYEEIKEDIIRHLTQFEENLTEEQKKKLQTLALLYHRQEREAEIAVYKAGFKTALTLALEAHER